MNNKMKTTLFEEDSFEKVENAPENSFMVSTLIQAVWGLIDNINSAIITAKDTSKDQQLIAGLKEVLDTQYIVLGQLEAFTPVADIQVDGDEYDD